MVGHLENWNLWGFRWGIDDICGLDHSSVAQNDVYFVWNKDFEIISLKFAYELSVSVLTLPIWLLFQLLLHTCSNFNYNWNKSTVGFLWKRGWESHIVIWKIMIRLNIKWLPRPAFRSPSNGPAGTPSCTNFCINSFPGLDLTVTMYAFTHRSTGSFSASWNFSVVRGVPFAVKATVPSGKMEKSIELILKYSPNL